MAHLIINDQLIHASISRISVERFFRKMGRAIREYVQRESESVMLEGPVEIDECLLFKPKAGYERMARPYKIQTWILGMRCRQSKRFLVFPLKRRTRQDIIPLIIKHVKYGSWIYTDCFSTYVDTNTKESFLRHFGYVHFHINHSRYFVNPIFEHIHTNSIERLWRSARKYTRDYSPRIFFDMHLACWYFFEVYDRNLRENVLLNILRDV
jgi:uncharacterized protein YlbG (UPF0298 family)